MWSEKDLERRKAKGQAVNEAFESLETFQVDRRRIVLDGDDCKRSGGYGTVRQAQLYSSSYLPTWWASRQYGPPQHVAVKQIKISEVDNVSDAKRAFTKEVLVWSSLGEHPGIAKFLGFHAKLESSEAWLLSPWEPHGNVMEFIQKRDLEVPEKLSLVYDTIDALTFLHQLNPPVCHGDIKSANVLINSNCRAVLCDFGLARLYEDIGFERLETTTGFKGSIRWCSPEILDGHPRTPSSDVYAWAWLVWEIMTGELPYAGTLAEYSIIRRIFESPRPQVDGESRLGDCLQVWELMTRCWAADPQQRPTTNMCRTTIMYLPRCPPTPDHIDRQARSATLLENIGELESWKGNYAEGLSNLEQALQVYEQEGNALGVASVLRKQTVVYHRHSYHLKALEVGVGALEKFRALNDSLGTAEILYLMGSSLTIQDNRKEAMSFLKEAHEIFKKYGNDVGVAQCLERIGEVHRREWQYAEATSAFENAVEIARRSGDRLGEAKSLVGLGMVYGNQGQRPRGVATLSEAHDTARKIGWEHGVCTCLIQLAHFKALEGSTSEEERLCREAISIARRSNAWWRLAQGLARLGSLLWRQGQLDEAAATLEESCSVFHKISLATHESARTAAILATVKRRQGRVEDALFWYDHAIAQHRTLRDMPKALTYLTEQGDLLVEAQRYDEAAMHFEACLTLSLDRGSSWHSKVRRKLVRIPKTTMQWEHRKWLKPLLSRSPSVSLTSPLLCDVKSNAKDEALQKDGGSARDTTDKLRFQTLYWKHDDRVKMSSENDLEKKQARGRAVDEAYERLKPLQVDRRRIAFAPTNRSFKRSGGYGIVRQAQLFPSSPVPAWLPWRQYGPPQHVAVKQIKISEVDDISDAKRAFTKELLVWSGLQEHPGIAKFLGFYAKFENSEAWLLSPWEPYGNVMDFVRKRELEVPEKLSLVYDTIDALAFLHQLNPPVCHGDIKSANVLINSNCRAVLCDFGLARLYEDIGFERLETSTGFKGSIRWCSPEILDGHPRTPNSDVYAWAWLVWEIMTGELPYAGTLADYSIIRTIFESPRPQVDGESRLGDCLQVWELMMRCWLVDPQERPTASMCRTTITYLPRCPPTPDNIDPHARSAMLLENMGELESWKGNCSEGLSHLEQALRIYEQEGDERGIASVLRKQAVVYHRHSYHHKALEVAVEALEKCRELQDSLGMAETLYLIGSTLTIRNKNDEAMAFLKEALEMFQTNGHDVGVVQCLERIGEIYRREWEHEEASSTLESALEIARRGGDKLGEAKALLVLGLLYSGKGDQDRGASTLSETCDTARRIGWEQGVYTALIHLGTIKASQGSDHEAEELCREAVSVARRSNARWRLAQGLSELGRHLRRQGQLDEAATALEESCSVYHEISLANAETAGTTSDLATLKREQGRLQEALFWYDQAIIKYRTLGDTYDVSRYLDEKGEVWAELHRHDEAALHFEACLLLRMEHGYYYGWTRSRLSRIEMTAIQWEQRKRLKSGLATIPSVNPTLPLLCDMKRLQRRIPQVVTANLKLPIRLGDADSQ